jgi:hypothetical protein
MTGQCGELLAVKKPSAILCPRVQVPLYFMYMGILHTLVLTVLFARLRIHAGDIGFLPQKKPLMQDFQLCASLLRMLSGKLNSYGLIQPLTKG